MSPDAGASAADLAELVVLCDEAGQPTGTAPKATVHHGQTPLHLAFSCYVFDPVGRFLLTRRASGKRTWPGVWTNSCCGHPLPGEPTAEAVLRRARDELGLSLLDLRPVLPDYRYRAERDGIVENEICPVYAARADGEPRPNPAEVADVRWVRWAELSAVTADLDLSPWFVDQLGQLRAAGASLADLTGS
jgi:isopentenyl-diphosphate delta-isomerase